MTTDNTLFIVYLLCKDQDGLYIETKFMSELNLEDIKKNNGFVKTFYDENLEFVNITSTLSENGHPLMVKDNKFQEITLKEIETNIHNALTIMINQAYAGAYIDHKRDVDDTSILDSLKVVANKLKLNTTPANKFDQEIYFNAYKALSENIALNTAIIPDEFGQKLKSIRSLTIGLNTFIASEGTIYLDAATASKSNYYINSYEEEKDGEPITTYGFNYSSAARNIHEIAHRLKDESQKIIKKLKM